LDGALPWRPAGTDASRRHTPACACHSTAQGERFCSNGSSVEYIWTPGRHGTGRVEARGTGPSSVAARTEVLVLPCDAAPWGRDRPCAGGRDTGGDRLQACRAAGGRLLSCRSAGDAHAMARSGHRAGRGGPAGGPYSGSVPRMWRRRARPTKPEAVARNPTRVPSFVQGHRWTGRHPRCECARWFPSGQAA
jgi:hypothetical protein